MFFIFNKTFELDNVYTDLQKSGHGNYAITNTGTPTRTQLLKIFSYSNPESKALFMFQITSGQRIGDVIKTTFDNIEMKHDCPRVFYPDPKTKKYVVKTRITPEAKQFLQEYLEQREKFIETRKKRGEHKRKKKLDMNRVFPMDKGTANAIWNTMLKNAGLYKLDPNTKRPVYGTHCLRRYFLSHFSDNEWGDFFSGHSTPRNKEYRQYSDEKLDELYKKHMKDLIVFETTPDLSDLNIKMAEKDKQMTDMQDMINDLKMQILELKVEKHEKQINNK
jgi:integrase